MAKRFFYVCGGILMLTFAYHLGASSARAQASGTVDAAIMFTYPVVNSSAAVVGRTFYYQSYVTGPPLPGTGKAVAIGQDNPPVGTSFTVMLENGEMYHLASDHSAWTDYGNAIGPPLPVQATSFGALKVKYR